MHHKYLLTLVILTIFFGGCRKVVKIADTDTISAFGKFFQDDFPFITTTVNADSLGESYPKRNVAVRGIVGRLEHDFYYCFDTDLLRMAVAWRGDSLELNHMAGVSYQEAGNKTNQIPRLQTKPIVATGLYAGWQTDSLFFEDPRPANGTDFELGRGPIDPSVGRWNGVYVDNNELMLSYEVGGGKILEKSKSFEQNGVGGIVRNFEIRESKKPLYLVLGEVLEASVLVQNDREIQLRGNEKEFHWKLQKKTESVKLSVLENRYVIAIINAENVAFSIGISNGSIPDSYLVEEQLSEKVSSISTSKRWEEWLITNGKQTADSSGYSVEEIQLPMPNPWNRNVRLADIDFFDDGLAVAVTFDGDIWLIEGLRGTMEEVLWKRFASGLYEPMSIVAGKNKEVYVFGRDQITRLHDRNNDGEADFYENFCNLFIQSVESREFPLDMIQTSAGEFLISKGAALDAGPRTSERFLTGFRKGTLHSGRILKIAKDGKSIAVLADGLREAYLLNDAKEDFITASDQQGNYVPSTPVYQIEEGGYYGVPATTSRDSLPTPQKPLLWIPHFVDQSGSGQVFLGDALLHLSYGEAAAFRIYPDSRALIRIPIPFTFPTQKGVYDTPSESLFITGFQIWGSKAVKTSGLARVRKSETTRTMPTSIAIGREGILLNFDTPLSNEQVASSEIVVSSWNYHRTEAYGSGFYRADGTEGKDTLEVVQRSISTDKKSVLLFIPTIQPTMQLEVQLDFPVPQSIYFTLHELQTISAEIEKKQMNILEQTSMKSDSGKEVSAQKGEALYARYGCVACHSIDGSTEGRTGTSFKGLYGSERKISNPKGEKLTVIADDLYLRNALLDPSLEVVEGYEVAMSSYKGILSENDIESLLLYIKSLK